MGIFRGDDDDMPEGGPPVPQGEVRVLPLLIKKSIFKES